MKSMWVRSLFMLRLVWGLGAKLVHVETSVGLRDMRVSCTRILNPCSKSERSPNSFLASARTRSVFWLNIMLAETSMCVRERERKTAIPPYSVHAGIRELPISIYTPDTELLTMKN
jgi:hypothetical protein